MKIKGLTKVRNEEKISKDTLDHWGKICTGGIYVYDDVSKDRTPESGEAHPCVNQVIRGEEWDLDRERAEYMTRQCVLERGKIFAEKDDWFCYFDADERIYLNDWSYFYNPETKAIACRLYDVYITPEDVLLADFWERKFVGPEFRTIPFFFRNSPYLGYDKPDQRIVNLEPGIKIIISGIVKHYGKGISIEHWEETCDYYINFWPKYEEKWEKRKGKAVKDDYLSDFGNKLILFNDVLNQREKGLEFRQNSISAIYAFDICGMSLPDDLPAMLRRLYGFLKQKGQLYIIDHDYDYICRSYLSGDLPLAQINEDFRRVCYLNKESIVKLMIDAGFQKKNLRQWYEAKFPKRHFE